MIDRSKQIQNGWTLEEIKKTAVSGVAIALCGLLSFSAVADTRIAILDFELNDVTLDPRRSDELERTASIKTLRQKTLYRMGGGYDLIEITSGVREKANAGFGYLFLTTMQLEYSARNSARTSY